MNLNLTLARRVAYELKIETVVVGRLEHGAAVIAALDHVVAEASEKEAWRSWHASNLANCRPQTFLLFR
jgi:hypothetical protein